METAIVLKIFIIFNFLLSTVTCIIKFTNTECNAIDKEFVRIKECRLKVVGRNKVSLNLHFNMLKLPLQNVTIRLQLLRKSNDYRPFLYNSSMNFCGFLKNGNKHMFWKIAYNIVQPYSNVNHTCPYNHDLILKDLILDENRMKLILLPAGDYQLRAYAYSWNDLKLNVNIYITISEY